MFIPAKNNGFTLIELIVVFAIFFLVTTLSLVSFGNFTSVQALSSSVLDVKAMLNESKSNASSQLLPVPSIPSIVCNPASPQLTFYSVRINLPRTYSVWIYCNSALRPFKYKEKILPAGITFGSGTAAEINFSAGTGQSNGGTIRIVDSNRTKNIIIDTQGNIN